jgi:hypothetical protein
VGSPKILKDSEKEIAVKELVGRDAGWRSVRQMYRNLTAQTAACLAEYVPAACVEGASTGPIDLPICIAAVLICYEEHQICEQLTDGSSSGAYCASAGYPVRSSVDPNDLSGPPGYGSPMWIGARTQMQYALSFNNLPTATKPATNVFVTDVVDPSTLDLTTLTVNGVSLGNQLYPLPNIPLSAQPFSSDIDLRPTQNLILRVTGALDRANNQVLVNFLSRSGNGLDSVRSACRVPGARNRGFGRVCGKREAESCNRHRSPEQRFRHIRP